MMVAVPPDVNERKCVGCEEHFVPWSPALTGPTRHSTEADAGPIPTLYWCITCRSKKGIPR